MKKDIGKKAVIFTLALMLSLTSACSSAEKNTVVENSEKAAVQKTEKLQRNELVPDKVQCASQQKRHKVRQKATDSLAGFHGVSSSFFAAQNIPIHYTMKSRVCISSERMIFCRKRGEKYMFIYFVQ